MTRDNFSAKVIERLRARVSNRCSNPDCRVPTTAAGFRPHDVNSVGQAAHIHAAAPGGARYLSLMSRDERRSIENAIWLCAVCATKIDRDVKRYPSETLRLWKEKAEAHSIQELGRPLPGATDATDMLVAAMTGQALKFLPMAIRNIHDAATQALEALDPRFKVETEFCAGIPTIVLHAQEAFDISIIVPPEHVDVWQLGLSNLTRHAFAAKLPMRGVRMSGSPIFGPLGVPASDAQSSLSITPIGREATVKLLLHDPNCEETFAFDDVPGKFYVGRSTARFVGVCCSSIARLTLEIPLSGSEKHINLAFKFTLCSWEGLDALQLPHFEKLYRLSTALGSGWELTLTLEVQGNQFMKGTVESQDPDAYYKGFANYVGYISRARSLARHTGSKLTLTSDLFSVDDHLRLDQAVSIFEGRHVFNRKHLRSGPMTQMVASKAAANLRQYLQSSDRYDLQCSFAAETITVFATQITLPAGEIDLTGVRPRVQIDLENVQEGDLVPVIWEPEEDFLCTYRFVGGPTDVPHQP
jgi:hypothetical protein